jgi:hypothetical protein
LLILLEKTKAIFPYFVFVLFLPLGQVDAWQDSRFARHARIAKEMERIMSPPQELIRQFDIFFGFVDLHFGVRKDHDVNLNSFDVVTVVANDAGQFDLADFVHLVCVSGAKFDCFISCCKRTN